MAKTEDLENQVRIQEMDILRLRAKNGWLAAQVARLARENEGNYILDSRLFLG